MYPVWSSDMDKTTQYYTTETDVAQMLKTANLPDQFRNLFGRDYVAMKRDIASSSTAINDIEQNVVDLFLRVDDADAAIDVTQQNLSDHENDNSAHNATGNIVGTGDYASLTTGGTVKQASAIADQAASTVVVTSSPNVAPAAYLQADAATWVAMLNELKSDVNQLVTDVNSLTAKLNAILASDRASLQRAP